MFLHLYNNELLQNDSNSIKSFNISCNYMTVEQN